MKKNIIKTLSAAAGILLLTACSNEVGIGTDVDAGSITIQATIGQMTKVEYPGINSTKFVADDTILVYGWIGSNKEIPAKRVVDSVPNVYDGTAWTPLKPMLWKNATDAHYFLGIYPEPKSVTSLTEAEFTLDPANYKASDLLIATNLDGVKATDGPVNLTFEHVMAKLNVNLKFRNEFGGTPDVSSVTAGAYSSAKVNYLTKEVTTSGTAGEVIIPKAAEPAQGFEMSFTGLQIPQKDVNRISITIGNRVFVYTSAQEIPLESGKYTTLNLIVGKDIIELDGISVKDWAAGTTIGLEEAKEIYPTIPTINGHEYVDLGLPSGLKWATCNVGATKPEEYGDYFAWGDTVPYYKPGHAQDDPQENWKDDKDGYTWTNYRFRTSGDSWNNVKFSKYNTSSSYGPIDSKTTLDPEDDAARYNWGSPWRMPTKGDFDELLATKDNTTDYTWTWCDGSTTKYAGTDVAGWQIVRTSTGATLFLPAAGFRGGTYLYSVGSYGHYWSSSLSTSSPDCAWYINFDASSVLAYNSRGDGLSVRPVCP